MKHEVMRPVSVLSSTYQEKTCFFTIVFYILEFFGNINFRRTSIEKLHFAQRFGTKREQMQRLLRKLTEFPKKSIIPQETLNTFLHKKLPAEIIHALDRRQHDKISVF